MLRGVLMGVDRLFLFGLKLLDLGFQLGDLLGYLADLRLILVAVERLAEVERFGLLELQLVEPVGVALLFLVGQSEPRFLFGFQREHLAIRRSAEGERRGLVELRFRMVHELRRGAVDGNDGLGKVFIVENDAAVGDKAVAVEHTGKGLREDGFAGAGFADDGDGFVLVNIERNAADGRKDTAADTELDFQILYGEEDFLFFHIVSSPYICVRGSDASPRFWPTTYSTTVMKDASATGDQNSKPQPGVTMALSAL